LFSTRFWGMFILLHCCTDSKCTTPFMPCQPGYSGIPI
jgi:hypothetical protein